TEDLLLRACSLPVKTLPVVPTWLMFIENATKEFAFSENSEVYSKYTTDNSDEVELLLIFYPLIEYGMRLISQRLKQFEAYVCRDELLESFKKNLLNRILQVSRYTLSLE